jgi:hypothetical protein
MNHLLTIRRESADLFRTALTQCASWCVYLMAFVMRQPSERSTPPADPRLDDTSETEAGARWMTGRSNNAGTLANGFPEMRSFLDIKSEQSRHYFRFPLACNTNLEQLVTRSGFHYERFAHASRSFLIRKLRVLLDRSLKDTICQSSRLTSDIPSSSAYSVW